MQEDPFSVKVFHKFVDEVKKAIQENHRRIFVFPNEESDEKIIKNLKIYYKIRASSLLKILFASHASNTLFQKIKSKLDKKKFKIMEIEFPNIQKVLGQTFDILVLDLTAQLKPNDLGIIIETVKGGGIILFITPEFELWKKSITLFQRTLISPPFTKEDLKFRFTPYFIESLKKYQGIIIFDDIKREIIEGSYYGDIKILHEVELHATSPFKKFFYDMAVTEDQKLILNTMEFILKESEKKKIIILTADRGRGKSAILGIGAVAYSYYLIQNNLKSRVRILVTAPEIENVEVLMQFAKKALISLNYKLRIRKNSIISNKIVIEFKPLLEAVNEHSDLTIIDECASISIPILFDLLETSDNIVYSSTIHGYEGAGRGFSILFRKQLHNRPNLKITEAEMKQPIRYALNDPIEEWLFETLFLKAQPAHLNNEDIEDVLKANFEVKKLDLDECFLGEQTEMFTNFAGIFVFAHYRNQPDDIVILSDSPHHEAWAIFTKTRKNIINVVQIAKEGGLSKETINYMLKGKQVPGNLIPWIAVTHFRHGEFANLKGARIVRIATHPELYQKGLGSVILNQIEEYYKNNKFDWIGTSFGLSKDLLNFWTKNGYSPIHLSSRLTPSTGEYSIIMLKPLTEKTEKLVKMLQQEFKFKIFEWLRTIFYTLPSNLAYSVLESTQKLEDPPIYEIRSVKILFPKFPKRKSKFLSKTKRINHASLSTS
ncbi:MAG: GNAT family N-acetyltransferase [Candidatus Helarchaeota archaeon]